MLSSKKHGWDSPGVLAEPSPFPLPSRIWHPYPQSFFLAKDAENKGNWGEQSFRQPPGAAIRLSKANRDSSASSNFRPRARRE